MGHSDKQLALYLSCIYEMTEQRSIESAGKRAVLHDPPARSPPT